MQSRRKFIKITSGALALSSLSIPNLIYGFPAGNIPQPGVQLFTFYNFIDTDVAGTLKKAAAAGIKNIESAFSRKGDYYGLSAKDFSSLLQNMGMKWRSHHVFGAPVKMPAGSTLPPFKNLVENTQQIIDDAAQGGLEYLVAAHLPISTGKEISSALEILNKAAEATKKAGIQLVYHNEPADFAVVDGKVPYEVFLTETDPAALKFELDIAWAIKAGSDPLKLIERYPGRFPLWHIKDLDKEYKTVLPIGQGILDYKKYFQYAKASGLKYYFIEHEAAADPFTSIASSIADLKKNAK
ncbi:sugar phosphate isomerase/epimerase family protein [Mucilaginibacter sp.]|jgi:sugar phosphate isomerase/epimerase|uniref:sugar phosphate isomerase/epimerase family protein n=1 Tax=Mucilaginibacter sp. TaxID=1882438 RepID=UPI0035654E43